jgi:hypothetical protein
MFGKHGAALVAAWTLLPHLLGCCCTCGGTSNWQFPAPPNAGSDVDTGVEIDHPPADPALAEDLKTAREHAQKALKAKRAGIVKTAELRKDGTNWYVSGTAETLDGPAPYEVWFQVTRSGDRQVWAVRTVKVNDEIIYP